jgi:hypothetical protein
MRSRYRTKDRSIFSYPRPRQGLRSCAVSRRFASERELRNKASRNCRSSNSRRSRPLEQASNASYDRPVGHADPGGSQPKRSIGNSGDLSTKNPRCVRPGLKACSHLSMTTVPPAKQPASNDGSPWQDHAFHPLTQKSLVPASTRVCYSSVRYRTTREESFMAKATKKKAKRKAAKSAKPSGNLVLRRETVLQLAQIVREARSRQSRKVCVA